MKKLSLVLALILLLCACDNGVADEQSDASDTSGIVMESETTTITTTSEETTTTSELITTSEEVTTAVSPEEKNKIIEENLEWIYDYAQDNYGASVVVKLKETDYDFSQEGKSMEEIIKVLWERNIIWFYTLYNTELFTLYSEGDDLCGGDYKIIHYFFDDYAHLKKFLEETYVKEEADYRLYNGFFWNRNKPKFYENDGNFMCAPFGIYIGKFFYDDVPYEITNVTDDVCEFSCYVKYYGFNDYYVTFEVPCTAVKENGEWRLTEMIGEIFGYRDKIMEENGYTFEDEFVPYEMYKVPR